MHSKVILIKFPDDEFHTANVNRFVSVNINGKNLDTIWYTDLTEMKEGEEEIGSYSVIRNNNDGTYTNLNCGTSEDYEKLYEYLKKEIQNKNYTNKDVSILPYNIDTIESYNYQEELFPKETPKKELSPAILEVKKEISTRIGAFVDHYYRKSYNLMEEDLCLRLTLLEEKMNSLEWEECKNNILSYLTFKKIDMSRGYIVIDDASNILNEIEDIALKELKIVPPKETVEPVLVEDDEDLDDEVIEIVDPENEKIEVPKEELKEEKNTNYIPYIKTIYVLWNELYSNLASFIYIEYDSLVNITNCYTLSYYNISLEYEHIDKEILRIIGDKQISISNSNLISVNDKEIKYNFYIIPIEDYDVFVALKESHNPYIITKKYNDPFTSLIEGIKRHNIIVTESETISIIK